MPMSPTSTAIRKTVEAYLDRHPGECDALAGLLAALDRPVDAAARTTLPGHITCSAVVIDRQGRILHLRHPATGDFVRPPSVRIAARDRTLLAAALRATVEEAGIAPGALCLTRQLLGSPIDIDVDDEPAAPSTGEPARRHYDLRYAFYLADEEPMSIAPHAHEASSGRWLPQADVASPALRAKLRAARLDGRPEPVNASALIHDGSGRYLLHLRDHKPGLIWAPGEFALLGGGRTHDDRSLEDTLKRELSEEVPDLLLEDVTPYAVEAASSIDGLSVPVQVFAGRWRGTDRLRLLEGVLLRWFTPRDLDRLRLDAATRDLIHRHAADNPPGDAPDAVPAVWDGGNKAVLNGIGVHLHLEDAEGRVLLGLRHPDSKYAGDTWHYPAGRCEREPALSCLVREVMEETGLVIEPADAELAHVAHVVDAAGVLPLMQLVFKASRWEGVPEVLEPDKCLTWKWWPQHDLPERLVPYTRTAIAAISEGRHYSQLGW
ncbi:NUDIX domain-containing protein [Streptomyces sp. NPDC101181]|uniref:NUDIX domain-containing protein n=1 Tax=Streptomyces sp. NPDC101181 TaxID=3366125 RepID=UPI00381488BF